MDIRRIIITANAEKDLTLVEMILLGYMVLVGVQGQDWINWYADPRMELRRN